MTNKLLWRSVNKSYYYVHRYFFDFLDRRTPAFLKPILRGTRKTYEKTHRILQILIGPKRREEIHDYWKQRQVGDSFLPRREILSPC